MIDFILSKLGILIFAISMASILLFFSMSVKDVFLADQTVQVSNIIAKQIKYMSESDTLCASKRVLLPRYIDIYGVSDKATFTPIYYGIKISVVASESIDEEDSKFVVFDIYNKKTGKSIGLETFKTNANIIFVGDNSTTGASTDKNIDIDPTKNQVLYMLKNSYSENIDNIGTKKTNIYFISCKYDKSKVDDTVYRDCYTKFNTLLDIQNSTGNKTGEKFYCVPTYTDNLKASMENQE